MSAAGKDDPATAVASAGPRGREEPFGVVGGGPLPPSLDGKTVIRIPRSDLEDATQEAWAAYLSGEDPNVAVWAYLQRTRRQARRVIFFSEMTPEQCRRMLGEGAEEEKDEIPQD